MTSQPKRVAVKGSTRHVHPNAQVLGQTPDDERIEVTVRLRRKKSLAQSGALGTHRDQLPGQRSYLSHDDYAQNHGLDDDDVAKVVAFANEHDLVVLEADAARRSVFLSGTAKAFCQAFGTHLEQHEHDGGVFRARSGDLTVPASLADIIDGVFGLDDRPVAKAHVRHARARCGTGAHWQASAMADSAAATISYTPLQVAQLYNFPAGLDGSGQTVAIIELAGGYRTADIKNYFHALGLPVPKVSSVRVDGAKNAPGDSSSSDREVMLDIEVAAAVAPRAHFVVYFTSNTEKGFLDAITRAIHDTVNKPSVISISWGGTETNWTDQARYNYDQAFQTAAAMGITICCSTGDDGSSNGESDGLAHATFPSVSPHVLACGGTKLSAANGQIISEVVWNDMPEYGATGGGISTCFPVPDYQANANLPPSANPPGTVRGRGIPDVAGNADSLSGYQVLVDGDSLVLGGTSAVAPLWAGLIALINQQLGQRVGFLNPLLYGSLRGQGVCRDIVSGNNGAYQAQPGWDACTGWGSPNGVALLQALAQTPVQ